MFKCIKCSASFNPRRTNQKYCSSMCRDNFFQSKRRLGKREFEVGCKGCGIVFLTKDNRKQFCNKECRYSHFNNKRPTLKTETRICPQCKETFKAETKRGGYQTYCSTKCQRKFNYQKASKSIIQRRKNWQKKNRCGGNWEAALIRDGYACQVCEKQLYPSQWTTSRRLVVHHLDGTGEESAKNHGYEDERYGWA